MTKKIGSKTVQNPNMDKGWFDKKLKERGKNQRDLARFMGWDPSTLHNTLMGFRKLLPQEAHEISKFLEVPITEVYRACGWKIPISGGKTEVRIAGWVDGSGAADIDWNAADGERVAGPSDLPDGTVAVQLRAAGAEFITIDGWLLFVATAPRGVSSDAIGRVCLCRVKGGQHLVRFVKRGYKAGKYTLLAENLAPLVDSDLEFATPVSWMRAA